MSQNPFQTTAILARLPMQMALAYSRGFARKMPELLETTLATGPRRLTSVAAAADDMAGATSDVGTTAPDDAAAKPRRKPGRPRKAAGASAAAETDGAAKAPAKAKRGPGRPRKSAAASEEAATPAEAPAKPKRKPGRPRKSAAASTRSTTETAARSDTTDAGSLPSGSASEAKPGPAGAQGEAGVEQKAADQAQDNGATISAPAGSAAAADTAAVAGAGSGDQYPAHGAPGDGETGATGGDGRAKNPAAV